MKKSILIAVLIALTAALPATVKAESCAEASAETSIQQSEIRISTRNQTIRVQNAQGETVRIYNLTGVEIHKEHIDSPDKELNIKLSAGCYIVKIGDTARKVTIR